FEPRNPALPQQHGNSGQKAAEPGEACLEPVQESEENVAAGVADGVMDLGHDASGVLQLVPCFGAEDARDDRQSDDVQGVGIDAIALEIKVKSDRGTDCRQPEQQ